MRLAIMQPYFFPYLGYFQLICAVDTFVFYDDVTFPKQGWVDRNRILVHGSPSYFTLPLQTRSSFTPIKETRVNRRQLPRWRRKLMKTLDQSYATSPHKNAALELVRAALDLDDVDVAAFAERSVTLCCEYLGIVSRLVRASTAFPASGTKGVERILEICALAGASEYVNAPGGRNLYRRGEFEQRGIALRFLEPQLEPYPQRATSYVPGLSIIDILMNQDQAAASRAAHGGVLE